MNEKVNRHYDLVIKLFTLNSLLQLDHFFCLIITIKIQHPYVYNVIDADKCYHYYGVMAEYIFVV